MARSLGHGVQHPRTRRLRPLGRWICRRFTRRCPSRLGRGQSASGNHRHPRANLPERTLAVATVRAAGRARSPPGIGATSKSLDAGPASPTTCRRTLRQVYAHPAWKERRLGAVSAAWHRREVTVPARVGRSAHRAPARIPQLVCRGVCRRTARRRTPLPRRRTGTDGLLSAGRHAPVRHLGAGHATEGCPALPLRQRCGARGQRSCRPPGPLRRCLPDQHPAQGANPRCPSRHLGPPAGIDLHGNRRWPGARSDLPPAGTHRFGHAPGRALHQRALSADQSRRRPLRLLREMEARPALGHPHAAKHLFDLECLAPRRRRQGARYRLARAIRISRVLDRWPRLLPQRHPPLSLRRAAGQRPGQRRARHLRRRPARASNVCRASASTLVYTHNYGCEPGSHLGFAEILRAADDVGMLVSFSQPHFSHYDWPGARRRSRPTATPATPSSTCAPRRTIRPS